MGVEWVSRDDAHERVKARIEQVDVVLDVGVGINPQRYVYPRIHICIEPHLPYIEKLRSVIEKDSRYVLFNCTWNTLMNVLPVRSVDSVFAIDFIEHLQRTEGSVFLREAERIARRQVVVFTPLGFYPQSYDDPAKPDRWGMNGGYWQGHQSGWQIGDFDEGWNLICCEAYHLVDEDGQLLEKPFGAIWAIKNIGPEKRSRTTSMRSRVHHLVDHVFNQAIKLRP